MPAPHPPLKPPSSERIVRPSVHLNWQDWLPYLEESDATEAEKRQLIETLWSIMIAFVDLGWDLGSPANPNGKETSGQTLDLTAVLRAAVLNSEDAEKEEV